MERLFGFRYRIEIYTLNRSGNTATTSCPSCSTADSWRGWISSPTVNKVSCSCAGPSRGTRCPASRGAALRAELESLAEWLGLTGITIGQRGDLVSALA